MTYWWNLEVIHEDVGTTHVGTHAINTAESQPTQSRPYRIAPGWREELRIEVFKLLNEGILIPSHSPWSAPMVPVRKTDGRIRLYIDYRALSNITVQDPYQMPQIEDLLDSVSCAMWLSNLDLNRSFYQIPMSPGSGC